MTRESTISSHQTRSVRGAALRHHRQAAGLSAKDLAQRVNDRTAGSDLTHHAVYSYESGKVLLSREVGHRIAKALNLHPSQLLLGDPDFETVAPASADDTPGPQHELSPAPGAGRTSAAAELAQAVTRVLPVGEVLLRLTGTLKIGRLDAGGYLDVFHLLLEDLRTLNESPAARAVEALGPTDGNEPRFQLVATAKALHRHVESLLKRLIDPSTELPSKRHEDCLRDVKEIAEELDALRGHADALDKRLPGVSFN
ncbi:MAG: helix-turn-helix transcriptional regulator [Planctomycetota bacterium]